MTGIAEVVIPVEAEAAAALTDTRKREVVGRIVSRILRLVPNHDPLLEAMHRLSADAAAKVWRRKYSRLDSPPIRPSGPADHLRRFGACQLRNRFGRCPALGTAGPRVGFQPAAKLVRWHVSDAIILDAVGRLVTQAAGASARCGGGQAPRCRRAAPACVRRFCDGRACPVHAVAPLRCESLGDVEAEPERALLLTVRRYNTVQDGGGHPAGGARQVALDARFDPER